MSNTIQHEEQRFDAWLRSRHGGAHARRTAERHAAFFLPHLKPGMRLLDIGCGPGSITTGLARAVAPGLTAGIDQNAGVIDTARERAAAEQCDNARFDVADCYALPFEDASFDAVFAHCVLQHLDEPYAALQEARRVLAPGGIIGISDVDFCGSVIAPEDPALTASSALMARMRRGSHVGKHLRELLHTAGFARTVATAEAVTQGEAAVCRATGAFWASYHEAPEFIEHVTSHGWATADEIAEMAAAWRRWSDHPGAVWMTLACHAVGWVDAPDS